MFIPGKTVFFVRKNFSLNCLTCRSISCSPSPVLNVCCISSEYFNTNSALFSDFFGNYAAWKERECCHYSKIRWHIRYSLYQVILEHKNCMIRCWMISFFTLNNLKHQNFHEPKKFYCLYVYVFKEYIIILTQVCQNMCNTKMTKHNMVWSTVCLF